MRRAALVFLAATALAQDPNAGLTAHWRFDDRQGTIAMDSAHPGVYVKNINTDQYYPDYGQYPGTIYNAKWIGGQIVGALGFDGHARVITPAIPVGPTFTVSAWVQPDPTMTYAYPRIIESQYETGFYLGLDMTAGMYKFIGAGGAGSTGTCGQPYGCVEGGAVKGNAWQLVTATYDGTTARLYVDGVQVANDTASIQPRTLPVYIGDYYGLPDYYGWKGGIDDVRIYGRALSPSEVLTLYNQASNVRLPPVVISGMKCKESSFLGKDTRTMTCAMTSQNTAWRGSLQVKLEHADPNIIQPPLNYSWPVLMQRDGKYAVTGVAVASWCTRAADESSRRCASSMPTTRPRSPAAATSPSTERRNRSARSGAASIVTPWPMGKRSRVQPDRRSVWADRISHRCFDTVPSSSLTSK